MTDTARGVHYADEVLPWVFDLDPFLVTGDSISDHVITVANPNGLTVPDSGPNGSTHVGPFTVKERQADGTVTERTVTQGVQFWPLGGLDDPSVCYPLPVVVCQITTAMGLSFRPAWVLDVQPSRASA